MEVILLEKIHRLGQLGDKVRVRAGYGRNYLIPQRRAVPATAENVEKFESQRAELEKAQSSTLAAALSRVEKLSGLEVTVSAKAAAEGKLYGSIGAAEIAEAVGATGNQLEKREIRLPDGPIRDVGTHIVTVHLHADAETTITVVVVSEDAVSVASEE
ncbi:MAG: 50S ribosomal protein L9 [Proteobacteria bacterium]|nr:50S ribosomal protein L9 [Pseudomonadota bacterium]